MKTIQFTPVALFCLLLAVALPAGATGVAAQPAPAPESAGDPSVDVRSSDALQTTNTTPSGQNGSGVSITDISYGGNATVRSNDTAERVYLWKSEPHLFNVTYTVPESAQGDYNVCLRMNHTNSSSPNTTCRATPSSTGRYTVTFNSENWTAGSAGEYDGQAVVMRDGDEVAHQNMTVFVLTKEGDFDSDKLPNIKETSKYGTDFNISDTDNDGLEDGPEVSNYQTDPLDNDTDGDGLNDGAEINVGTDPNEKDTDGDGLSDGYEDNHDTIPTKPDSDSDDLRDEAEVNASTNPLAKDTDGDDLRDGPEVKKYGIDPTAKDSDGDLLSDSTELEWGTNPTSAVSPFGWIVVLFVLVALALAWAVRNNEIDVPYADGARARINAARTAGAGAIERTDGDGATGPSRPLTDNERVQNIVESHGGQVRQSEIVDETGWSKAKVSRVLSRMEDDGEISKIRIGRENLICLPGHEPPSMQQ